jgi:hypothetical protein
VREAICWLAFGEPLDLGEYEAPLHFAGPVESEDVGVRSVQAFERYARARASLFAALQSGAVNAIGTLAPSRDAEAVPTVFWALALLDVNNNRARTDGPEGQPYTTVWASLRLGSAQVVLLQEAEQVEATPTDALPATTNTGMPGRPSSKHLYLLEFDRRAAAGEKADTLIEEAKALHKWLLNTHPQAPPATPKTIMNLIRSSYQALAPRPK